MRRSTIILIVAGAMLLALPATAKKPSPEPPPSPAEVDCALNGAGVLINPHEGNNIVELGGASAWYRCELTANPAESFTFVIETTNGASAVNIPYVAVTDVYPGGGDICFRDYVKGRVANPVDGVFATFATEGDLDSFGDLDGSCGESEDLDGATTYALTFEVGNVKGGTVQLTMTPQP